MNACQSMTFDSNAEERASKTFEEFGVIPFKEKFPFMFKDKKGVEFLAKPDFYDAVADMFIEFKSGKLNSITSKHSSANRLQYQAAYRGGVPSAFDLLKFGWNHSRHKLAIEQSALTYRKLIVVFDKQPELKDFQNYIKAGVISIPLECYASFRAHVILSKAGLCTKFSLQVPEGVYTYH